jgi:FHA domain
MVEHLLANCSRIESRRIAPAARLFSSLYYPKYAEAAMYYRLVPITNIKGVSAQGWNLSLPCNLGRNSDSQVCIEDESISRSHCQLFLSPDESLQVRDLGSLNGTYVNGDRINRVHSLVPGDALQVGSIILQVEYGSDTDPGKPPPKRTNYSTNETQPMKAIKTEQFTKIKIEEPTKKWWEFWK